MPLAAAEKRRWLSAKINYSRQDTNYLYFIQQPFFSSVKGFAKKWSPRCAPLPQLGKNSSWAARGA
jgi:hypothetical protein